MLCGNYIDETRRKYIFFYRRKYQCFTRVHWTHGYLEKIVKQFPWIGTMVAGIYNKLNNSIGETCGSFIYMRIRPRADDRSIDRSIRVYTFLSARILVGEIVIVPWECEDRINHPHHSALAAESLRFSSRYSARADRFERATLYLTSIYVKTCCAAELTRSWINNWDSCFFFIFFFFFFFSIVEQKQKLHNHHFSSWK